MAYGKTQKSDYLQSGINENVFLTKFTRTSVSTALYQGNVIDVEISNGSSFVSKRLFPITISDNATSDDTKKYEKRTTEQTIWLNAIISNYCSKDAWDAAMESVSDFDTLFDACKTLLPADFEKIPARVVLTYVEKKVNGEIKHYLEIPNVSWLNNPWTFFTTDPNEKLGVSKKIVVERPVVEAIDTPATPNANGLDDSAF